MFAQDCPVSRGRGAIARGHSAVEAWRAERRVFQITPVIVAAIFGFGCGWVGCFIWLLAPTLVYEH